MKVGINLLALQLQIKKITIWKQRCERAQQQAITADASFNQAKLNGRSDSGIQLEHKAI
jgi:hypothetical protein